MEELKEDAVEMGVFTFRESGWGKSGKKLGERAVNCDNYTANI